MNCNSCKTRTHTDEFEVKKGIKLTTCSRCLTKAKAYYEAKKCEHGKSKTRCVDCDGSEMCKHKRRRANCVQCGGASMCNHKLQRAHCKKCTDPKKVMIERWIRGTKSCDKKRKQETNITREFCATIITESENRCCYCHVELQMLERTANLMTIERIDNRIGHVIGNCRIACFNCNTSRVGQRPA